MLASRATLYKENYCREGGEVSTNGSELNVVGPEVDASMKLAKNEDGSVNGEIECLLLPE